MLSCARSGRVSWDISVTLYFEPASSALHLLDFCGFYDVNVIDSHFSPLVVWFIFFVFAFHFFSVFSFHILFDPVFMRKQIIKTNLWCLLRNGFWEKTWINGMFLMCYLKFSVRSIEIDLKCLWPKAFQDAQTRYTYHLLNPPTLKHTFFFHEALLYLILLYLQAFLIFCRPPTPDHNSLKNSNDIIQLIKICYIKCYIYLFLEKC